MGQSNQQPQNLVTTQNKDPWIGSQGFLTQAMGSAAGLYNSDTGYHPYTGQAVVNPNTIQDTSAGIQRSRYLTDLEPFGSNNLQQARSQAGQVIGSQGITPGIQGSIGGLQGLSGAYGDIMGAEGLNSGLQTTLQGLAGAAGQYGSIYGNNAGSSNPYLQGAIDAQGRKIADQVNSAMSGAGRYGSGAHTNVLSRNLAEASLPLLAQDYAQRQQTQLAATQGMQNALGQYGDIYSQGLQRQLAAAQGQGATQQTIADLYGQGLNRTGQFSQLTPALDAAQFANVDRSLQMGDIESQYQQALLKNQADIYNANEARPWEQIARYNAIIGGSGGLGGSTVTTQPNINASAGGLQRGLGGALTGAGLGGSIFGAPGAAIGAGIGGLAGYLL